jgi:hypothetical protein
MVLDENTDERLTRRTQKRLGYSMGSGSLDHFERRFRSVNTVEVTALQLSVSVLLIQQKVICTGSTGNSYEIRSSASCLPVFVVKESYHTRFP